MLTKLIKHEFSSNAKVYLPLYAAVAIVSIINSFSLNLSQSISVGLPQTILFILYGMIITLLVVVTSVLGIIRFKKNILGNEGYLMMTLPVSRGQLVFSKLFSATVWTILSIIMAFVSIILVMSFEIGSIWDFIWMFFGNLRELFSILFAQYSIGYLVYHTISALIIGIGNLTLAYLSIYLSMSIGHSFSKNKVLMSFVSYFGISIIYSIISTFFIRLMHMISVDSLQILALAVGVLVINAIAFFATTYMLKNRLNIE